MKKESKPVPYKRFLCLGDRDADINLKIAQRWAAKSLEENKHLDAVDAVWSSQGDYQDVCMKIVPADDGRTGNNFARFNRNG